MSTPTTPTEVHYTLRRCIIFSAPDEGAQLIADGEARACASLAMVAAESADRNASLRLENDQLRAALECMTPRYIELFEHAGLGPAEDSIAVEMAREALGLPNASGQPRPTEKGQSL